MRLVITEKPSVARDIARVLGARQRGDGYLQGDGVRVTWCLGHLVELEEPAHYDPAWKRWSMATLPMLPERFALKRRPGKGVSERWRVVRAQLRDRGVTEVINACDAGREGELIFRFVYELAGCARPVRRMWLSSMTDGAIGAAWRALKPGHDFDALGDAARCRAEADWLVGLNATRAMTCLGRAAGGDQVLSIGRVQTPTLAMVVARDAEIAGFVPTVFWQVRATFEGEGGVSWQATWFREAPREERSTADEVPSAERLDDPATAEAIAALALGRAGVVQTADRKRVTEKPPWLYDLTSLQRRANQRYSLTAQATLAIAQALYEQHKLITYPRTDAQHLTPDQVPELPGIVQGLAGLAVYAPLCQPLLGVPIQPGKRVVDAAQVGDHHAIIPTGRTPDPGRLSADEKRVFDLVARRFLAALYPDAVFARTVLVVAVPAVPRELPEGIDAPLRFRARGRVCLDPGWRVVDPPGSKDRELELPLVEVGSEALAEQTEVVEGVTRPPRPYNDGTLLRAMETAGKQLDDAELERAMRRAGLGTPATRAAILQTLLDRDFLIRRGKDLCATERGAALIGAVPLDELKSPELTGQWESRLTGIAERDEAREAFMADVRGHVRRIVAAISTAEAPAVLSERAEVPVLGACPVCGTPVREGRGAFSCETGRACAFVVFKKMSGRTISVRMVKALLSSGRTPIVKGFRSKAGKPFEAGLVVGEDGKVGFWFAEREARGAAKKRSEPASRAPRPSSPVGMTCPACGAGSLVRGRSAWGCDRWRQGCRFVVPFEVDGRARTEAEAVAVVLGT